MTAGPATSVPVQNVRTLPAPYTSVGYLQFNEHIATAEEAESAAQAEAQHAQVQNVEYRHADAQNASDNAPAVEAEAEKEQPFQRHTEKVGRNDACPCGSGKKFKQCHGQLS
jgi:uncharacterized protein YecA (UPF0149 family)